MQNWTVEQVKAQLPDVAVSVANQPRVMAMVAGRKEQFAAVYPYGPQGGSYSFAWEAIRDALNFDRALII